MHQPDPHRPLVRRKVALRGAAFLFGLGLLTGCGNTQLSAPYFVVVPQQTLDPTTALPLFSVCYNATLHRADAVRNLVVQHCASPTPVSNGSDLRNCSLSAPVRITYTCTALSRTAAEAKPNLPDSSSFSSSLVF